MKIRRSPVIGSLLGSSVIMSSLGSWVFESCLRNSGYLFLVCILNSWVFLLQIKSQNQVIIIHFQWTQDLNESYIRRLYVVQNVIWGHVHKYETVLWTLEKLRKRIFCYKVINFSLSELKFSGNMYFSYPERLALVKVEKVLSWQRNDKKVTLYI